MVANPLDQTWSLLASGANDQRDLTETGGRGSRLSPFSARSGWSESKATQTRGLSPCGFFNT